MSGGRKGGGIDGLGGLLAGVERAKLKELEDKLAQLTGTSETAATKRQLRELEKRTEQALRDSPVGKKPEHWTTKEVAAEFQVHVKTVARWRKLGLPCEKHFGRLRYPVSGVTDWWAAQRKKES